MDIWLIGSGLMAKDYCRVLQSLKIPFNVVGRGKNSATTFKQKTGKDVFIGGINKALNNFKTPPKNAIIAVSVDQLKDVAINLMTQGTKNILIEKPAGINLNQIEEINDCSKQYSAKVWVAYNRRFYSSTIKVRDIINEDGGAKSMQFDFTEWPHVISELSIPANVKSNWLLCNSSHVIDLAFHLCGIPKEWKYWYDGTLDWHPSSSRFCGAGVTDNKVLFSYTANWNSPGRWGLEITTVKRRLILRPLEKLFIQYPKSVDIKLCDVKSRLDNNFKPGLYLQTKNFINNELTYFCSIEEHLTKARLYSNIAGYIT